MEQVPFFTEFGEDNFADNPEPRCPCLLLLDVSGSMQGRPLDQLNQGLINISHYGNYSNSGKTMFTM